MIYVEDGHKYILGCKLSAFNAVFILFGFLVFMLVWVVSSSGRFEVDWNLTESLPQTFFVVDRKGEVIKGDYAAFNYYTNKGVTKWDRDMLGLGERGKRFTFIKKIVGVEGDVVAVEGMNIFINDKYVATAKDTAKHDGRQLFPIEEVGVIPKNKYYFKAPHKDSYDSRYSEIGLVDKADIRGKAYGFF